MQVQEMARYTTTDLQARELPVQTWQGMTLNDCAWLQTAGVAPKKRQKHHC